MSQSPHLYQLFVGVDIAATSFTAVWSSDGRSAERPQTFEQTPVGFDAFQQRLLATGVSPADTLIVLEATSTYWVALAVTLHQAGFVVAVVNPAQIHNYAKSLPRRSKTDALDAALLMRFAAERRPEAWSPPPPVYHELRQRLMARAALVEMRQQVRNQRHALLQWPVVVASVREQFDGVIAELDARIATLDREIGKVVETSAWASSVSLLESIPGIGRLTAAWVVVLTMNFALCPTPEAAVAYAGLVPLQRESGTSVRGRASLGHGGNARLRSALYLATLSAARHNPAIKQFYERLRAGGKPMKVARCAAARKLLQLAWAVVTKGRPFDPSYAQLVPEVRQGG
jgi:transposase